MITDVIDYSFGSKHPTLLKSYQRGVEAKDSKELKLQQDKHFLDWQKLVIVRGTANYGHRWMDDYI